MTTVTTPRKINVLYMQLQWRKNKSLQHRCEVKRENGLKIERGLITVGGSGGLSELVDMAASDPNLYCSLHPSALFLLVSGEIQNAGRRVERRYYRPP